MSYVRPIYLGRVKEKEKKKESKQGKSKRYYNSTSFSSLSFSPSSITARLSLVQQLSNHVTYVRTVAYLAYPAPCGYGEGFVDAIALVNHSRVRTHVLGMASYLWEVSSLGTSGSRRWLASGRYHT